MRKLAFNQVRFLTSATKPKGYPCVYGAEDLPLPEVAVAGRSNVGKSTLLNHLFRVKGLVKTSQKPGKTRLLNFFQVDDDCIFCDLPGYGYASISHKMQEEWGEMIEGYIEKRDSLKVILMLLDCRRNPSEQDIQFFEWIQHLGTPVILVFTKADKLSRGALAKSVQKNITTLGAKDIPRVLYSAPKNQGRNQLIREIKEVLNAPHE